MSHPRPTRVDGPSPLPRRALAPLLICAFMATFTQHIPLSAQEASEQAADPLAQAKGHWAKRSDPAQARLAIDALEAALRLNPDDADALALLSQACYFHGQLQRVGDDKARLALFKRGYEAGVRASTLRPSDPNGAFWGTVNLGVYGKLDGVLKSVSSYGEIRQRLSHVESLDPDFYHGGVWRYYGQLIDQVPGSLRSLYGFTLDDAVAYYQRAGRIEPNYLQTWIYLGECYLQMDRPDDAKQAFKRAAEGDPKALPQVAPENALYNKQARALLAKHFPEGGP